MIEVPTCRTHRTNAKGYTQLLPDFVLCESFFKLSGIKIVLSHQRNDLIYCNSLAVWSKLKTTDCRSGTHVSVAS